MYTFTKSHAPRTAVIGAGVAGIACANALQGNGLRITVLEKSRGLGGRLATRRVDEGVTFDHGAQYFTARSPEFRRMAEQSIAQGCVDYWRPEHCETQPSAGRDWLIGVPTMNALIKPLAEGVDIRLNREVAAVVRDGRGWRVHYSNDCDSTFFDRVVCTAPAPQAAVLFRDEPGIARSLAKVSVAPCWALMISFAAPFDPGFEARKFTCGDVAWVARNSSKPGRSTENDCWVLHASPTWSQRHLEQDRERIAPMMIDLLADLANVPLPECVHISAHRWRYALTTNALGAPFLCSSDRSLFLGGDWCLGARIESAYESGRAMAKALVESCKD